MLRISIHGWAHARLSTQREKSARALRYRHLTEIINRPWEKLKAHRKTTKEIEKKKKICGIRLYIQEWIVFWKKSCFFLFTRVYTPYAICIHVEFIFLGLACLYMSCCEAYPWLIDEASMVILCVQSIVRRGISFFAISFHTKKKKKKNSEFLKFLLESCSNMLPLALQSSDIQGLFLSHTDRSQQD